jgi:hypothetical protein
MAAKGLKVNDGGGNALTPQSRPRMHHKARFSGLPRRQNEADLSSLQGIHKFCVGRAFDVARGILVQSPAHLEKIAWRAHVFSTFEK